MGTEHAYNPQDALSALADGQLRGEAFAQAVERVTGDADAQATWHAYQVVGDVLRSNDLAFCEDDHGFMARFQSRLEREPILTPVLNTTNLIAINAYKTSAEAVFDVQNETVDKAANASRFQWKMVAGLASLVAVVAVGWNALGGVSAGAGNGVIAAAQQPMAQLVSFEKAPVAPTPAVAPVQQAVTLASGESQVMLRDARLDALMAAHKQFGGTSALQMPAGFLRNATFESPAP
ncbi:sigma-E factor negative regulatory protein [Rhodoferax sp.]|uniref:sigma-E factor negative regulatory protein n=1 Tax=Rhodoferax sp. TaxID=50421 RepID=UPI00374D6ADA